LGKWSKSPDAFSSVTGPNAIAASPSARKFWALSKRHSGQPIALLSFAKVSLTKQQAGMAAGTNPTGALSVLTMFSLGRDVSGITVSWKSLSNAIYVRLTGQ